MLLYKIFGFFDFLALISMFLLSGGFIPWRVGLFFAAYLILKGFAFKGNFASYVDIIIGVYIIIIPFFSIDILTIIFAVYLAQKAVFSFF